MGKLPYFLTVFIVITLVGCSVQPMSVPSFVDAYQNIKGSDVLITGEPFCLKQINKYAPSWVPHLRDVQDKDEQDMEILIRKMVLIKPTTEFIDEINVKYPTMIFGYSDDVVEMRDETLCYEFINLLDKDKATPEIEIVGKADTAYPVKLPAISVSQFV